MKSVRLSLGAALLTIALLLPSMAMACPACADAIAAAADNSEEVDNFPKAMNQSIYLMIAVPYCTLAVGGFFVYRGFKKNSQ